MQRMQSGTKYVRSEGLAGSDSQASSSSCGPSCSSSTGLGLIFAWKTAATLEAKLMERCLRGRSGALLSGSSSDRTGLRGSLGLGETRGLSGFSGTAGMGCSRSSEVTAAAAGAATTGEEAGAAMEGGWGAIVKGDTGRPGIGGAYPAGLAGSCGFIGSGATRASGLTGTCGFKAKAWASSARGLEGGLVGRAGSAGLTGGFGAGGKVLGGGAERSTLPALPRYCTLRFTSPSELERTGLEIWMRLPPAKPSGGGNSIRNSKALHSGACSSTPAHETKLLGMRKSATKMPGRPIRRF